MELESLYEAVPAAQEEDLLDEVAEERRWASALLALDEDPAPPQDEPDPDDEPPLRPGQVLGLLEHQLGAVVLPDDS